MDQEMKQLESTEEEMELKEAVAPEETMADYAKELEASFKKVREGDILTGTVISVDDDQVTLDLNITQKELFQKMICPMIRSFS